MRTPNQAISRSRARVRGTNKDKGGWVLRVGGKGTLHEHMQPFPSWGALAGSSTALSLDGLPLFEQNILGIPGGLYP